MLFLRRLPLLCLVTLLFGALWARAARAQAPLALGVYFYDRGLCAPGDEAAVQAWRAKTGRLPAVWAIYQSWTGWNQFPVSQAQRARALGAALMVTWEPWKGRADDPNWSCAAVAAGTYDPYIRSYARAVKSSGAPVIIRLAHEMNGDWYPWSVGYSAPYARTNGNSPAGFVEMWRHVVGIFREEGAGNAKWAWSPNVLFLNGFNSTQRQTADLRALYPGDAWVDWIGVSVYNDGARRPWSSFSQLFDGAYRVLTTLSGKPMMVAELGVTEEGAPWGASKAQWIESALLQEIPRYYPNVRLVNYFFRDKSGEGESNFRFDSSPAALSAFQRVAGSALYGGRGAAPLNPARNEFPVRVLSPALVRPREEAEFPAPGNNGTFRNGGISVPAPRLRVR